MLKQNLIPSRQGELYRVNLSHNYSDGPFLKKDIMQSNKRSMALLTGQGVLQSISHFNNSMTMLHNKTRQITSLFPQNIDNITNTYHKCESQLSLLAIQSEKLFKQQQLLKNDLQQIYQREKQNQQDLYHQCMPLLKGLMKTVKDSRSKQRDQYHLVERILAEISQTKKTLVEGMLLCEKRIIGLEQVIGWQTGEEAEEINQYP